MIRRAAIAVPIVATREAAWAVLTDLEQSATWLPGVAGARILTREGDISVIELSVGGQLLVLEIVESPPNGARFDEADGSDKSGISGSWRLRDDAADGLVLEAEISVSKPLFDIGAGGRLRDALERAAAIVADKLRRPPTAQLATYRRALSVVRRGNVIEAHIGGEVIEMLRIGVDE